MTTTSAERTALRSPSAVTGARQAARAFLEALGQPAIGREQADTVVLVVSELVTNALRHGGGTYTLRLAAHPGTIEVAVEDPSPRMPRMRTPTSSTGRADSAGTWSTTSPSPPSSRPGPKAARPYAPSSPAGPAGSRGLPAAQSPAAARSSAPGAATHPLQHHQALSCGQTSARSSSRWAATGSGSPRRTQP